MLRTLSFATCYINENKALTIPNSIGELNYLERLYLRGTPIASLPKTLYNLTRSLIEIDLSPDTPLPPAPSADTRLALPLFVTKKEEGMFLLL